MTYRLAIVTPTPNWHFPEYFTKLSGHSSIDLTMLFCSRQSLDGELLRRDFNIENGDWGLELLGDYRYKFLKNYPVQIGSAGKILNYINPQIWRELRFGNYDAVIIEMWNDVTFWVAAISCKLFGIPIFYVGDATTLTEETRPLWKRMAKKLYLGKLLFPLATGLLYRTELNKRLYLRYGISERKLYYYPLSVDYTGLADSKKMILSDGKNKVRKVLGVPINGFIVLYVGRLSREKRVPDLVNAFASMDVTDKTLIIVGDGPARLETEKLIHSSIATNSIYLTGFKEREVVKRFYTVSDILVLPSEFEPHGDVVKEGMCFDLPAIVSSRVGAAADVVRHGKNGFVYPCGDTNTLANYLEEVGRNDSRRNKMRMNARSTAKRWDHRNTIDKLVETLDTVLGR